jgi:hypothetical protein
MFCGVVDLCGIALPSKFILYHIGNCNNHLLLLCFKGGGVITGQIVEILADITGKRAVVVLDVFEVLSTRHEVFGMPMLARQHNETTYLVIPSTVRFTVHILGYYIYKPSIH